MKQRAPCAQGHTTQHTENNVAVPYFVQGRYQIDLQVADAR